MINQLDLRSLHESAGATFAPFRGWEVPACFSAVDEEYECLAHQAGLLDLSAAGVLQLAGRDRVRYLHGMVTNDVKGLIPGKGCYALILSPQGKNLADLRVLCLDEFFWVLTEPDLKEKVFSVLKRYIISEQVELTHECDQLGVLSLLGPKASQLVKTLFCVEPPANPHEHLEAVGGTFTVRLCRVNRIGSVGYDLIVSRNSLKAVWEFVLKAGKSHGVSPVGLESINIHRIENRIPWYGVDMDESNFPLETGLDDAISLNKGCYIGQESVARATYRGQLHRKWVGLSLSGKEPAKRGDKVFKGGQEVGWITSSVYSPRQEQAIALGYLRREAWQSGAALTIERDGRTIDAQVKSGSFAAPLPS